MGYRIEAAGDGATIKGCRYCDLEAGGIRDDVARRWPTAWRAVGRKINELTAERTRRPTPQVGQSEAPPVMTPSVTPPRTKTLRRRAS